MRYIVVVVLVIMVHDIKIMEQPQKTIMEFGGVTGKKIVHNLHSWVTGKWGAAQWERTQNNGEPRERGKNKQEVAKQTKQRWIMLERAHREK